MLAMLGISTDHLHRHPQLMSVWSDDTSSESLHETWKSSRLYAALEKMLSTSDSAPTTGKRSRSSLDELGQSWGLRVRREGTPLGPNAPRTIGPDEDTGYTSSEAKRIRLAQSDIHPSSSGQSLQLPPQTSQLLDIYFAATHSWFPILAKHNILRSSYLYANTAVSLTATTPGSGDHAALWAILSYTVTQSRTDPRSSPVASVSLVKEYYTLSRSLIPSEKNRYELGHIQALLLLTLVNMGLEDWTAAWLLSGQAVRMAVAMGLGTYTDTRRSDEFRQGKAVFLGCFVVDSLLSFRLRRCPAMSANDLATVGLLEEDGLEEWNSWTDVLPTGVTHGKNPPRRGPLMALSCFNRLVELASVLNKSSRNLSMGYKPEVFTQQLVMDLKQWDDGLPLGCRLIGPESIYPERHSALLPHQSYLGLTYVAALLWLYVCLIPGESRLHRSQRPATEGAKKLLYRGLSMLSQHLDNFPICGLPPLFEFALRTIFEQALSLKQTSDASETFPFIRWADEFRQKTAVLATSWPTYTSLVTSIERSQQPNGFHSATTSTPNLSSLGNMTPTHPTSKPSNPNNYASSIMGISIPVDGQSLTPKDTVMENTDLTMMENLQKPHEIYQSLQPAPETPDSTILSKSSDRIPEYPFTQPGSATADTTTASGSGSGSGAATEDLDAIFKDLAYLDTTEWSTNREAGLKDFGFLDDSTFQAFCHDPDRLGQSQPLVHPPSIADIWPPPGFFPETFQDEKI